MANRIDSCRICGSRNLPTILDLGIQVMTGIFPRNRDASIEAGPLELVKCTGTDDVCGLVQLAHNFNLRTMYGADYGYRSGLNEGMVRHLRRKVAQILERAPLLDKDIIIDIGSNDGTSLASYPSDRFHLIGIDPLIPKFDDYYPLHVTKIPQFFSGDAIRQYIGDRRARVISSVAMFYDIENPLAFSREVIDLLEDDGIWILEQSYLPAMLATTGYDTVCHEHFEYYALTQIKWMLDRVDAKIVDVELNDVNGGSFSLWVARRSAPLPEFIDLPALLARERAAGLDEPAVYRDFAKRVARSRDTVRTFFDSARRGGKRVGGIGASTKGNVLLQYCNVTAADMFGIGEVNADKFGHFTPGSLIPIIPESEMLAAQPDYLVALPWHYRKFFETSETFKGRCLVFPLPELSVVQR
ncbi:MAG: methyltransferase domain-containing protein [Alphaproteobacteria bacterium]|nr:methyltransferase domain-containing protein [Alphaproteobacteria bacterium]